MAAKMSIKDVARVMDLPLDQSLMMTKLVPDRPGIELSRVLNAPMDGPKSLKEVEQFGGDDIENVKKLRAIYRGGDLQANVLKEALILEGSVRGVGVHASAIIIAPKDLTDLIPVATSKDSTLLITQYDGKVIEDAGVIKMDFLGLKTLTIIRDALRLIEENHGIKIDIDKIPLNDKKTFELYQRGESNGTFQFESPGMQKYLKELKPDKFEDLIAMNALYRPGPIEYIPEFILRKHGRKKISYDLPEMKEFLEDTYGITVYQEQVMLLSQKLANFSKGDADVLRKAMGKKDKVTLDKMKNKFIEGTTAKGFDSKVVEKIWTDWEAFAQYAFNKSHSTCYAFVAYQTAYLKTHYPGEYMASVLTHNLGNIDKITFFMEEARRMGVPVLGPDVNESEIHFAVNKSGQIRFGMGAIKGVGENAAQAIISERKENGQYKSIFDLVRRVNLRAATKKTLENLVVGGGMDSFTKLHRATYFKSDSENSPTFLEKLIRFGQAHQDGKNSSQVSLFDSMGANGEIEMPEPPIPIVDEWDRMAKLKAERDAIGIYLSGHPLDDYRVEMKTFCKHKVSDLKDMPKWKNHEIIIGGMITAVGHKTTKTGKPFGTFILEDYNESHEFALFGQDYVEFKKYILTPGLFVFIRGMVQERSYDPGTLEFKTKSMELLSELMEKRVKNFTINLPIPTVNEDLIERVKDIVKKYPGKAALRFNVFDSAGKLSVEMHAKKIRVKPENALFKELDAMIPEASWKVN